MCDISIIIAVYNHEKYIEKAINSVLLQEVSCSYEVLIGEDCSTDRSREILKKMKLPDNFHIFYRETNYGPKRNFIDLYERMSGKYFIVLEGDDYWLYPGKLQEEYDFLEKNKDYLAVAHNTVVVGRDNEEINVNYPECKSNIYDYKEFEKGLLPGQTTTILCRNYYKQKIFDYEVNTENYPAGDRVRAFLLIANGKVYCIQKKWSAYRYIITSGSSFSATYVERASESLQYYRGIYMYAKQHEIEKNVEKITECLYAWNLIRCLIREKQGQYQKDLNDVIKDSKNKRELVCYIILKVISQPVSKLKYAFHKIKIKSVKRKQI